MNKPPIPPSDSDPGVGGLAVTPMGIFYTAVVVSLIVAVVIGVFSTISQLSKGDVGVDLGDQVCLQSQKRPFDEPECFDVVEVYNK